MYQQVLFNLKIASDGNFARILETVYGHDEVNHVIIVVVVVVVMENVTQSQ